MNPEITKLLIVLAGFMIGWGLRGYMDKLKIENKTRKKITKSFLDK